VVEHAVEHHADVAGVGVVEQFAEGVGAAKQGVHLVVVVRVVAVVGRRRKDGVQVEGRHPQVVEVIEGVNDAVEVSALEALLLGRTSPGLEGHVLLVLDLPAAGEAVGKDLVEDGVLDPVGSQHQV
jgi:hypothetical protein